jgi:hypothetical protein
LPPESLTLTAEVVLPPLVLNEEAVPSMLVEIAIPCDVVVVAWDCYVVTRKENTVKCDTGAETSFALVSTVELSSTQDAPFQ